jgi:hypothetical protein
MDRRAFLGMFPCAAIAQSLARSSRAPRPVTLDLRDPMRLGAECVLNRMDSSENHRPWFAVEVVNHRPTRLRHDVWDFGDTGGRFLEALILARQMTPATPEMLNGERHVRSFVMALLNDQDIVWNPDQKRPDHMFAQGSALYGLVSDFEASRDPALRARIQRFIAALDRMAVHENDYLWFPQVATKIAPCSHMAAYQVLPIVRFYELTGYLPALKYAERLSRWAFYHDPTVTPDGVITKTFWEGHLHAWMDTFSGIIRCSRAGSGLDHGVVVRRSQKLYEWVRANYTSPFGWVADSVGSKTCETDTITSGIRLALELIKEGHPEYWNDVERFTRNQLVENQFRDVTSLAIRDATLRRGLRGSFESYADPNTLLAAEKGDVEGCCINGGMRGLFLAYQNAITESRGEVRVNLLLSAGNRSMEVVSFLPYEGRLELYPMTPRPILLRCPEWLRPERIRIGSQSATRIVAKHQAGHLRITGAKPGSQIVLRFEQPEEQRTHWVAGRTYRARWRGDTVIEMLPSGGTYPIFTRSSLDRERAPIRPRETSYQVPRVHW